jgi:ribose 5-phosphate isomerase B
MEKGKAEEGVSDIIGLCSDHAGYPVKEHLRRYLREEGVCGIDFGTHSVESCDYPDYAHLLASAVEEGRVSRGIAVCATGNGIAMTLNKHAGIRAALCWDESIARLSRAHNDANVLVLPGAFLSPSAAVAILRIFLDTPFEGGRHQRRIDKIAL